MVMTRGFKRRIENEEEKAAAAAHAQHILSITYPGFTSHQQDGMIPWFLEVGLLDGCAALDPNNNSLGIDAQTSVNVSSAETDTPESQSKKVSSCLTTMAEAEVDKPPLQVHPPVRPCSLSTIGRYPYHNNTRVPCKRNRSTAAIGTVKKEIRGHAVAHGINVNASLSKIHHNTDIHALPTKGCIQSVSPSFLLNDVYDVPILNEDESIKEVNRPIVEDRSNSSGEAESNAKQDTSLNLSAMDALDDDGSSFNSDLSSVLVTVGGYKVKENLSPILRNILSKHGDIAAHCCKKSIMLRSLMVENVCDIVQKLQTAEFVYLKLAEVENLRVFVQDIESDNVNVGWLLHRLNEIHEAKRLLKESSKVKQAKTQSRQVIKEKEEEISELQEKIASAKKELELQREEERKLDGILSDTKLQVKRFHCGSMIDGLLI